MSKLWAARMLFFSFITLAAILCGYYAQYLIGQSELQIAANQYESIADHALSLARKVTSQQRHAIRSMAVIFANAFPDAKQWPFVYLDGYHPIVDALMLTSSGNGMAMSPFVKPEQQVAYEEFAYDNIQRDYPTGYGESSFGRGIFAIDPNSKATDQRYHDHGVPMYNNSQDLLVPVIQVSRELSKSLLMFNGHSRPGRGRAIDAAMACGVERANHIQQMQSLPEKRDKNEVVRKGEGDAEKGVCYEDECTTTTSTSQVHDCGVLSDTMSVRGHIDALLMEPVYPAHNPTEMVAVIGTNIIWSELLSRAFSRQVSGVDCIIETTSSVHSFTVTNGHITERGEGDFHNPAYDSYRRSMVLTENGLYEKNIEPYTIHLYPNESLFAIYSTSNPLLAQVGVMLIMLVTSLLFMLYDSFVSKERIESLALIEAKRRFVRFISHEVRTPLNTVCIGLRMVVEQLQEEYLASITTKTSPSKSDINPTTGTNTNESTGTKDDQENGEEVPKSASVSSEDSGNTFDNCGNICDKSDGDVADSSSSNERLLRLKESTVLQWTELLNDILMSSDNAVDVLNDLLNYDKIEMGTLSLELTVVPFLAMIKRTANEFKTQAKKSEVQFVLDIHDETAMTAESALNAVGDPIRLTQVLRNLMSNALKFTPEDGCITIDVSWRCDKRVLHDTHHNGSAAGSAGEDSGAPAGASRIRRPSDLAPIITTDPVTFKLCSGESRTGTPNGMLRISVTDTGAGMSEKQVSQLFGEGVQFNVNELQSGQGSGLGLYIAKGIAEQHGGSLTVSSEGLGKGTTFTFLLPLYTLDPTSQLPTPRGGGLLSRSISNGDLLNHANSSSSSSSSTNEVASTAGSIPTEIGTKRILIVDDALSNRKMLAKLLTSKKHICDQAKDGQEAINMYKQGKNSNQPQNGNDHTISSGEGGDRGTHRSQPYDTILMDYEMPVLNGPAATKQLRDMGCTCLIVGITGNVLPEDVKHFKACGAQAVLPKPIKFAELESVWRIQQGEEGEEYETG